LHGYHVADFHSSEKTILTNVAQLLPASAPQNFATTPGAIIASTKLKDEK
jgi:hypothetical protein